jgi:hypothetical protein
MLTKTVLGFTLRSHVSLKWGMLTKMGNGSEECFFCFSDTVQNNLQFLWFNWMFVRNCFAILFMNSSYKTILYENINIISKKNKLKWKFYLKPIRWHFPLSWQYWGKNTGCFGELLKSICLGNGVYITCRPYILQLAICNLPIWFSTSFIISKYMEQAENSLKNHQIFVPSLLTLSLTFRFLWLNS